MSTKQLQDALWIGPKERMQRHPILSKELEVNEMVELAQLDICGLGLFEAYLNGEKIGNEYLAPLFSDYTTYLQVFSYDVTPLLMLGENRLEIWLGNGWYKGRFGLDLQENNYGDRFAAIAQLALAFASGRTETISTDESWQCHQGAVVDSGIYDGETQDYNQPFMSQDIELLPLSKEILQPRKSLPIIVHERLTAKELLHTPKGELVLDFGQNFAGWVEFDCALPEGETVTLEFGEVLQEGNFFNDNYRTASARFRYTSDGQRRTVRPHFTYFGFRYVRLSGFTQPLNLKEFEGCVIYSNLQRTGHFCSGNEKINRLYENALWSQKSNFFDLPTDCPQRDERLGWTGDAQVFSKLACINMDCKTFFDKFLSDLRTEQLRFDGAVPNYIPNIGFLGGACSAWGDAATIIPMNLYDAYGDKAQLARHYPMMCDWLDWITRQDEARGAKHLFDFGFHFGDWLAQDGVTPRSMKGGTDDGFLASVYYCHSARLVKKAAQILQYKKDEEKYTVLSGQIEKAIFQEYFTQSGRLSIDTQAAYLISLYFNIYVDEKVLIRDLKRRFERDNWKITCGFVGAPILCQTLANHGMQSEAMHFLMNEGYPGWLHCINLGATTIWERWNSLLPDGTCNGIDMNSFNHYAYGSVAEYLYNIAGLNPVGAGWSSVRFQPLPDIRLGHAVASYESVNGLWESAWTIDENGMLSVRFSVPKGCAAVAVLPYAKYDQIVELSEGVFQKTYLPTRDLRQPYTMDTLLVDMLPDKRVVEILTEALPQIAGLLQDPEAGNWTLNSMQYMGFLHLNSENIAPATKAILSLRYINPHGNML